MASRRGSGSTQFIDQSELTMRQSLSDDQEINCLDYVNIMADLHDIKKRSLNFGNQTLPGCMDKVASDFFSAMLGKLPKTIDPPPPPTKLRKTSKLDSYNSPFQTFMNYELQRAEDLEFEDIPEMSGSLFGDIIDYINQQTKTLAEGQLGKPKDSFLEMRYYINFQQSELLRRSVIHMEKNAPREPEFYSLGIDHKTSTQSAGCSKGQEEYQKIELTKAMSCLVPERQPCNLNLSLIPTQSGLKFAPVMEFIIIIQELTLVYLCVVRLLIKAEKNLVQQLALYGYLVFSSHLVAEVLECYVLHQRRAQYNLPKRQLGHDELLPRYAQLP